MEFQYLGKRYLVSWQHFDGSGDWLQDAARDAIEETFQRLHSLSIEEQKRLGVPFKIARTVNGKRITYDGLTICRIRTLKPDAETLPPSDRWETVAEGYAFKRSDETSFDKKTARRTSLSKTLSSGAFPYEARTSIWLKFLTIWPPVSKDAGTWEKRYAKLQQEYRVLEQQFIETLKNQKASNGILHNVQ